jgi:hypothetical protein
MERISSPKVPSLLSEAMRGRNVGASRLEERSMTEEDDGNHADNPGDKGENEREILRRRRRERAQAAPYPSGYSKPEKKYQFQPGHTLSRGRRKSKRKRIGLEDLSESMSSVLSETTSVRLDGNPTKMQRSDVYARSVYDRAVRGNNGAGRTMLHLLDRRAPQAQEDDSTDWNKILRDKIEAMVSKRAEVRRTENPSSDGTSQDIADRQGKQPDTKKPEDKQS